jgi:hypothetical protein
VPRWLALSILAVAAVADAGPKPRYALPAVPPLATMTRAAARDQEPLAPHCFAYSAKQHVFACVGHDSIFNMNNVGAPDQATNIRIDVVGATQQTSWTIAAIGNRPTTRRAIVEGKLGELGLRALAAAPVTIPVKTWVTLGSVQVFLRVDLHEGDASFENFGDLTLRCGTVPDHVIDLRAAGMTLGDTAVAYLSPDRSWLAISIVGLDGGEDTYDYSLDTAVIDVAATCAHRNAAVWTTVSRPDDD